MWQRRTWEESYNFFAERYRLNNHTVVAETSATHPEDKRSHEWYKTQLKSKRRPLLPTPLASPDPRRRGHHHAVACELQAGAPAPPTLSVS